MIRRVAWLFLWGVVPSATTSTEIAWRDLGPVPGAATGSPPQGMAYAAGRLIFTQHEQDRASTLFTLDPITLAITGRASLPAEATHTSGLAWDGTSLWAVDYNVQALYQLDLDASLAKGEAVVLGRWSTELGGASALAWLEIDNLGYLAISDFLHTGRSYLVPVSSLGPPGPITVSRLATCSWPNGMFSQGLTWDGHYLYEAVNRFGTDELRVYDLRAALAGHGACEPAPFQRLPAGGPGVEDLASDGTHLWTSDERTWRFYGLDDLPALRAQWKVSD